MVERIRAVPGAFEATALTTFSNLPASLDALSIKIASILSFWPTLSISDVNTSSTILFISSSFIESFISTAKTHGFTNFFSCLKRTVSSPIFEDLSPEPMVIGLIGGADSSPRTFFASSETSGHKSRDACLWASFIAKARHVGCPHFLQFVFGSSLNI